MVACSKLFIVVPFYRDYIIQHSSQVRREPGSICAVIILRRKKKIVQGNITQITHIKNPFTLIVQEHSQDMRLP